MVKERNTVKQMFADAMKTSVEEKSFDKITIGDLCEKCDRNRKSFYYHFKSKYDLLQWIFHTECIEKVSEKSYGDAFAYLQEVCKYLAQNERLYRKVFKHDEQQIFSKYFRSLLVPVIEKYTCGENAAFYTAFYADAFVNEIQKWLLAQNRLSAKDFVHLLQQCMCGDETDKTQ